MNPELKQRLIGAVVVTALAAIFIPMLFDDPVGEHSQSVASLPIPATPINTGEQSANQLPTSATQTQTPPVAESGTVVETKEEAELTADNQPPAVEPTPNEATFEETPEPDLTPEEPDQAAEEPISDGPVAEPDNEPVDEPVKVVTPAKPKVKTPAVEATAPATKPPAPKTEQGKAKLTSRWSIQAGTFSKKDNAVALMETLRKQGLPVTMSNSKGMYRLKVGPVLDKKRAQEMQAKLKSQNISSLLMAE